ncbi:hypothetical protein SKAU_G00297070 [Synaphobranchus kaupii]|uniref:DUF4795 domain-containing protein n=1 Tax=Synaphobranchus kaupii TaxID=118154 RepID=A0A9Q1EUZ1_SYNKA|nr:hypothetical protein SKAU_G00297070 [Synaphobranchus kaupii]
MSVAVSLFDLVNLSVGTPDVGAVNFNALHTLLHAVVRHLEIQNVTAEWMGEDGGRKPHDPSQQMALPRGKPSPHHHMEDKLIEIERQIAALETLPSATDLLTRTSSGTTPVSDMWQLMQIRRKVQANEDGVSKSMTLIQDLLNEIRDLRASRDSLQDEIRGLHERIAKLNVNKLQDRVTALEKCCHQVANLENVMRELQERMAEYPDREELTRFITWDVLQEALVNQKTQQTEVLPTAEAGAGNLNGVGRGSAERYPETVDALRRLGRLGLKQEALEDRVTLLEESKADHAQLQEFRDMLADLASRREIPESLLEQISELRTLLDSLTADRDKSSALMSDTPGSPLCSCRLSLENERGQREQHIENLYKTFEQLEEKKADKDHVEMEIDVKADKQALEAKVSRVQFDSMTEQLSAMFQDLLGKVSGQEQDWHKVIQKISTEMECKSKDMQLRLIGDSKLPVAKPGLNWTPLKQQLEERWKDHPQAAPGPARTRPGRRSGDQEGAQVLGPLDMGVSGAVLRQSAGGTDGGVLCEEYVRAAEERDLARV